MFDQSRAKIARFIDWNTALFLTFTTNAYTKSKPQILHSSSYLIFFIFLNKELYQTWPTRSKSGKEYVKAAYCYPIYLTYMQSTSWEILGWMKHKL